MKTLYVLTETELDEMISRKVAQLLNAANPPKPATVTITEAVETFARLNFNKYRHGYHSVKRMIETGQLQTLPNSTRIIKTSLEAYIQQKLNP